MSKLIDDLLVLQRLVQVGQSLTSEQKAQLESVRKNVPVPVASHFFRQVANGRKGIALVRNGVCGECHLRLPASMVAMLAKDNELLVCESCSSFVTLAPGEKEAVIAKAASMAKMRTAVRKPEAVAV